jgi:hypothetical protein
MPATSIKLKRLYIRFILLALALIFTEHAVALAQGNDRTVSLEQSRKIRRTPVTWEEEVTYTFDDPAQINLFEVAAGKFEIKDGALRAIEGSNRAIMLKKNNFGNYIRIEMDVTSYANEVGRIGDISFFLNSIPNPAYSVFFANGYAFTTASYGNSCTSFYKKGLAMANTEFTPLVSGKKNLVVLEFMNGHIRYWMNGQILLESWDETPLQMNPDLWIGVRSFSTLMVIDKMVISKGKPM